MVVDYKNAWMSNLSNFKLNLIELKLVPRMMRHKVSVFEDAAQLGFEKKKVCLSTVLQKTLCKIHLFCS